MKEWSQTPRERFTWITRHLRKNTGSFTRSDRNGILARLRRRARSPLRIRLPAESRNHRLEQTTFEFRIAVIMVSEFQISDFYIRYYPKKQGFFLREDSIQVYDFSHALEAVNFLVNRMPTMLPLLLKIQWHFSLFQGIWSHEFMELPFRYSPGLSANSKADLYAAV